MLSAAKIVHLKKRGMYGDGNGLWLQVSAFNTRSWLFRFMLNGRARGMGLGPYPDVSLKEARQRADTARRLLRDGIDPIEERKARRLAAQIETAKQVSFGRCVEEYLEAHSKTWRNEKHRDQWRSTLEAYAGPVIGKIPVASVDTGLILKVLRPIWNKKPETASRLRGRIERVLAWATVSGYRTGDNPARWRGHLKEMLPEKSRVRAVQHHKAVPYQEIPAFMARLRATEGISARALEFTILNAVRTGATIGARLDEINIADGVWTLPGVDDRAGTKNTRELRIPLCERSLEILKDLPQQKNNPHIFAGAINGKGLSQQAMLELVRGMLGHGHTVHGFRSSFKDWAAETTNYPGIVSEMALGHTIPDKVEAAYRRGDLFDKRKKLLRDWGRYCQKSERPAAVINFPAA